MEAQQLKSRATSKRPVAAATPNAIALGERIRAETIPDWGRRDARLVLIGEAAGFYERVEGAPFVGRSGRLLAHWWRECSPALHREDFYITNVVNYQPLNNKIATVGAAEMHEHVERLHATLATLDDPWLIVPTGNTALKALTGQTGITRWRGSILSYKDRKGRTIKVVPTIHPAQILRVQTAVEGDAKAQPAWERACRHDWQRITEERSSRELNLPKQTIIINPTVKDLKDYTQYLRLMFQKLGDEACIATDIETPKRQLYCIGFAADDDLALVVNWRRENCRSDEELAAGREFVKQIWEGPIPKATQNGVAFDSFIMERKHGIKMHRLLWDTMSMHHCLDPADRHSLEYLLSIYTRVPYYKNEAKEAFTSNALFALGHEQFARYCGKDCLGTRMLVPILKEKLSGTAA